MPIPNGIDGAAQNHAETELSGPLHAPEVSALVSDLVPPLPFQIDFVDAICSSASANGLSFPELLGTVVNFLNGAGILIGVIMVLGVGVIAYGLEKSSSTQGGGGGKNKIYGGIIIFVGGVLAWAIPEVVDQSLDGGGSCIVTDGSGAATVMVPPEMIETATTVATVVL